MAAAVVAQHLKFEGKLVLQARSGGQIPPADGPNAIPGTAGINKAAATTATATRFDPAAGRRAAGHHYRPACRRYQGIVPLRPGFWPTAGTVTSLQSEQSWHLHSLASDGTEPVDCCSSGSRRRSWPGDAEQRARQWEHARPLAANRRAARTAGVTCLNWPTACITQDLLRLFLLMPLRPHSQLFRERTRNALSAPRQVQSLLQEMGVITMIMRICNQQYRFAREDLWQDILDPPCTRGLFINKGVSCGSASGREFPVF